MAKLSLSQTEAQVPSFRISQRMKLEQTQLDGVERRIQNKTDHCLLLGLPCGVDANDIQKQSYTLQNSIISYLLQKQAAGIINLHTSQVNEYFIYTMLSCVYVCIGYSSTAYIPSLCVFSNPSLSHCS